MHSVTLHGVGNLIRDPELKSNGGKRYTRFGLVTTDFIRSSDGAPRKQTSYIWFVAFDAMGAAIAEHCRCGDQIFLRARVESTSWLREGKRQYSYNFIAEDIRFGRPGRAKREELAQLDREGVAADEETGEVFFFRGPRDNRP